MFPIEGDGGGVGFGDLQKDGPASLDGDGAEQGGGHAATPEGGIDGDVEDLGFVGGDLTPGAESGWRVSDESEKERISRVVAKGPLGGLGAAILDAGNGGIVVLGGGADQDGGFGGYGFIIRQSGKA